MGVPTEKAATAAANIESEVEYLTTVINPVDIDIADRDRLAQCCIKLELYLREVWSPTRYIFETPGKPL